MYPISLPRYGSFHLSFTETDFHQVTLDVDYTA
jgi:hypothetical protein